MNLNHIYYILDENIYNAILTKTTLQSAVNFGIIFSQSQKTIAEPGNSNDSTLANNSTPYNRAFFVCSVHSPKENNVLKFEPVILLSMVACSGKGFALCCFPMLAVFQPVTRYRPKAWKLYAVTLKNLNIGVTQMYQFIFAAIRRTDLTNRIQKIRITADNELSARAKLAREFVLVLAGRINLKSNRTLNPTLANSSKMEVIYA